MIAQDAAQIDPETMEIREEQQTKLAERKEKQRLKREAQPHQSEGDTEPSVSPNHLSPKEITAIRNQVNALRKDRQLCAFVSCLKCLEVFDSIEEFTHHVQEKHLKIGSD